jgi:integrase
VLVDWVSGMKVCPSTRQGYVISFRTVLTTAETLWDATPNMKAYEKASVFLRKHGIVGESESRDRRVTDAELEAILAAMVAPRLPYRDILFFQLHSAFRIGETCRLRWADLNEEDRTVLIRQRKHPKKKTDEIAPLLDAAWEIIQRQPRGGEFIFPYEPNTISHAFADFAEGAGVEDIHVHDLRHEAISRLFEMGFDITEVRLFSGHKDLKMLQRYTHLRPRDVRHGPVAIRRYHEQVAAGNVVPFTRAA